MASPLGDRLLAAAPLLIAIVDGGSFAAASARLDIDPSAVSHRVRALEQMLGFRLFERTTRRVRPTRSGRILCEASRRAMEGLDQALASAREARRLPTIRLSTLSSVAMKWLVPRLPAAREAGLDLSVSINEGLVDLNGDSLDAALRFGVGPYPGLHTRRLMACSLQAVAAPALLAMTPGLTDPLEPQGHLLLGDTGSGRWSGQVNWARYAAARKAQLDPEIPCQDFDRADLMLQAAIGGLGLALGRSLLIEDDLRNGLLVPIGPPVQIEASYWLVTSYDHADSPDIRRLGDWLSAAMGGATAVTPAAG